jgi:hypothetical protein
MLTGTPLDLTVLPEVFQFFGKVIPIVWLLLVVSSLTWAWRKGRKPWGCAIRIGLILVLLVGWPVYEMTLLYQDAKAAAAQQAEYMRRRATAEALFKQRCETAGETIFQTIENVKGVVWMKWRPHAMNTSNQFGMDDPYGRDCGGDVCIRNLLRSTLSQPKVDVTDLYLPTQGYDFVETKDPIDGQLYRYTAGVMPSGERSSEKRAEMARKASGIDPGPYYYNFMTRREPIARLTARYGITWDDISTREDRAHWIAGGSLSIVDLRTTQVIAKRVGYMWDRILGSQAGFRSPWLWANTHGDCKNLTDPSTTYHNAQTTREFSFKVLQPTQGAPKP